MLIQWLQQTLDIKDMTNKTNRPEKDVDNEIFSTITAA